MTDYWDWPTEDAAMLRQVKDRNYSGAECALDVHAHDYERIPETFERFGVSSKLQWLISDYLKTAVAQGYGKSELAALVEIMSQPEE